MNWKLSRKTLWWCLALSPLTGSVLIATGFIPLKPFLSRDASMAILLLLVIWLVWPQLRRKTKP